MSTGMPELGSKISLISKADIRYEGRLFTVDPQECTIALASVRSFGTEDRETQYPVAPQNQVYDYILFRGSDIKDIRVVNSNVSTLPNDPAIMQLSVPPSLGQQTYQPQGFSHPVLGPMGPAMGQYNNPYGGLGAMGALPSALAPGMAIARDLRNLTSKQQQQSSELLSNVLSGPLIQPDISSATQATENGNVLDLISGGSRSTTPVSLISRKSPTNDQGVQAGGAKDDKKTVQRPIQPPRGGGQTRERKESRGEHDQRQQQQNQHHQNQRNLQQQQHHPQQRSSQHQQHHQQQNHHPQQQQQQQQQHQQHQQQQQNRGGWINRGQNNNMRQRGRGRGGQGMFRPPQGAPNPGGPANKGKTLKFDNDYDFEQANTEFEELRSQLAKVKIAEVEPVTKPVVVAVAEVNGDSEKKDDSGNETGAGEGEHEEDSEVYYDKSKSFFDNISCEAVERSKGRSQRTDWRTERKLNSETFGVSSTRRGGYRGRGGYYNRGMYRGGYRGNYRGQGQQHHQQQQQHQQHHQQQQRNHNNTRQNSQGMPMREMQPAVVPNQPPPVVAAAGK